MDLLTLQLVFMGVIFTCTSCVGVAPVLLGRVFSRKFHLATGTKARLLSDASCFGAGVFLFVCFLGLLPAADEKFHDILEVHTIEHSKNKSGSEKAILRDLEPPPTMSRNGADKVEPPGTGTRSLLNYECHIEACGVFEEGSHSGVPSSVMFLVALSAHSVFEGVAVGLQTSKEKILEYSMAVLLHEVVMALTFGLEVSKSTGVRKRTKLLYVFIFTASIPLGIAVGIGLQNSPSDNREVVSAIIEAFATGIFIHVIFIEILATEFPHLQFDRHKCRLSTPLPLELLPTGTPSDIYLLVEKIACICAGFLLLILTNVFLHGHSH